jgi:NADH:ubiquinone reductase (H+-translocating)
VTHHVVVVGGGLGGLPAARFLGHVEGVDVTLVDRRNHHLFQPLLYQVATGMLSPGEIAPPLRHVLRRLPSVSVELLEVDGFDLEGRVVHAARPPGGARVELPYDTLIVAAGAGQSYFGHDEFALYAPGMKTIDDAMELRRRILGALELAETATTPEEQREWLTVVVVGAGPTGVEIAGQIRELATRSLHHEFATIDPGSVRVVLVDGGKEPLATFGDQLSGAAERELRHLGVELRMNARVINIDSYGVDVETKGGTERITARTVVWAAGVQASPLAATLATATGAQVDRAGRIAVLADLTLPGHPEVFAVGDMVTYENLPGVAEVAMQGGLHAANTIQRRLGGDTRSVPYRYRDIGSVATIGRFRAVCSVRGIRLSGFPAWMVWLFVHLAFLNGFGNRFTTLRRWMTSMLGRARPERVFSVAHTGGDLSTSASVRALVQPTQFPAQDAPGKQS